MQNTPRSDLVVSSRSSLYSPGKKQFQFFERRSPSKQFRKTYNRGVTKTRESSVPSLSLDQATIDKFESTERPASRSISRITQFPNLETPRSISNFVLFSKTDAEQMSAAQVIQRNWKVYSYKKKMNFFLTFILRIRRRRLSYALSLWLLATMPRHESAERAYASVFRFLLAYSFIYPKTKKLWILKGTEQRLMRFDEYMKTNILFSKYPKKMIVNMHKNLNRDLVKSAFHAWFSIASERMILSKSGRRSLVFAKFRENFGPEYWTYHVWRRWARYKKRRRWEMVETISSNLYVPEWTYYRAKKLTEARLRREATLSYKIRLGKTIVQLLRDEIHRRKMLQAAFDSTVYFSNRLSMLFGYKAFNYLIIFKRVKQGTMMRSMRAWYTVTDSRITNRAKVQIFFERRKLKAIQNSFKSWRKNIIEASAKNEFLHADVVNHSIKILPFVYLMTDCKVHYTFVMSFVYWKKLIEKKKRLQKFVNWSMKRSKKQVLLRFMFDVLKDNSKLPVNRMNYQPFHESDMHTFVSRPNQQFITCPTTSVVDTINAYQDLDKYIIYDADWATYASSRQVQTLFFRLICLIAHKGHLKSTSIEEIKSHKIKDFIETKQLFSQIRVSSLRYKHHKEVVEKQKEVFLLMKRDNDILSAFDTHYAAIELSKHVPKFSVNKEPKSIFETAPETYAEDDDDNYDNSLTDGNSEESEEKQKRRKTRTGRQYTPSIPFLRPIKDIKESLMKMTLKYRRRPNDAFSLRAVNNRKARQSLDVNNLHNSQSSTHFGSIYEHFSPFKHDEALASLIKDKDFTMKELQSLKKHITEASDDNIHKEIEEEEEIAEYYSSDDENQTKGEEEKKELEKKPSSQINPQLIKFGTKDQFPVKKVEEEEEEEDNELKQPQVKNENNEKVASIQRSLEDSNVTTLNDLESHFLNDGIYFSFDQERRVAILTTRYLSVLELLLGGPYHMKYTSKPIQNIPVEEKANQTDITKLLKKINNKINEENQKKTPVKTRSDKKKRTKLFEDPDKQFEEEKHTDGNTYQKSTCPEFNNVLFSGVKVLSNTPWNNRVKSSKKDLPPLPSLPTAENVVPGFEPERQNKKLSKGTSLFIEKNPDIKKILNEILDNPDIDDDLKKRIMNLIDSIAKRYLDLEVEKYLNGELISFVDVDPNDVSSEEAFEFTPVFQLRKPTKIEHRVDRRFAAFDSESREKPPMKTFRGQREVFYKDLALSILECSKYMTTLLFKEVKNIKKERSTIESLKLLKRLQTLKTRKVEQHTTVIEGPPNSEVVFTAGGHTKRTPPHKIQNCVKGLVNNKMSQSLNVKPKEIPLIEIAQIDSKPPPPSKWLVPKKNPPPPINKEEEMKAQQKQLRNHRVGLLNTKISYSSAEVPSVISAKSTPNTEIPQKSTSSYSRIEFVSKNSSVLTGSIDLYEKPEINKCKKEEKEGSDRKDINDNKLFSSKIRDQPTKTGQKTANEKSNRSSQSQLLSSVSNQQQKRPQTPQVQSLNRPMTPFKNQTTVTTNKHGVVKRRPQYTKFEAVKPDDPVEFEFDFDETNVNRSSHLKHIPKPKWRIPNDMKNVNENDMKYFMYVTPFVAPEGVIESLIEQASNERNNQ